MPNSIREADMVTAKLLGYSMNTQEIPAIMAAKQKLIEQKIYVPTLWPNVLCDSAAGSTARRLTRDILPLPCDQRYGPWEMDAVIAAVLREL